MSRINCILLALLLAASGCGGGEEAASTNGTTTENSPPAKRQIGYSALEMTNPFFKTIADTMTEEAAKHGYELLVVAGNRDSKKQADQIDDFIVKNVSAIILNPCDTKSIGPAIKRANDAGIPVFTNDLAYTGGDVDIVSHVATDNYQGGKLAGEAMVKAIGDTGGKVAIIDYKAAESCQLRVKGFKEILAAHNEKGEGGKFEVVSELDGGGVRDEGYKAAKDTIESHPDLAAVFAINDPSALGAHAALEAAGKADQVTIIGFDAFLDGKLGILEGKILCDPVQYPRQIGAKTIELLVKHFDGEEVEKEVLIPSKLYYKADAEQDPALEEYRKK